MRWVLGLSSPPPAESSSQPPDSAAPFPEQAQREDKGFFSGLLAPILPFSHPWEHNSGLGP